MVDTVLHPNLMVDTVLQPHLMVDTVLQPHLMVDTVLQPRPMVDMVPKLNLMVDPKATKPVVQIIKNSVLLKTLIVIFSNFFLFEPLVLF